MPIIPKDLGFGGGGQGIGALGRSKDAAGNDLGNLKDCMAGLVTDLAAVNVGGGANVVTDLGLARTKINGQIKTLVNESKTDLNAVNVDLAALWTKIDAILTRLDADTGVALNYKAATPAVYALTVPDAAGVAAGGTDEVKFSDGVNPRKTIFFDKDASRVPGDDEFEVVVTPGWTNNQVRDQLAAVVAAAKLAGFFAVTETHVGAGVVVFTNDTGGMVAAPTENCTSATFAWAATNAGLDSLSLAARTQTSVAAADITDLAAITTTASPASFITSVES